MVGKRKNLGAKVGPAAKIANRPAPRNRNELREEIMMQKIFESAQTNEGFHKKYGTNLKGLYETVNSTFIIFIIFYSTLLYLLKGTLAARADTTNCGLQMPILLKNHSRKSVN